MNEENEPTSADYHAAVERYLAAIDKVLAAGREAVARSEQFYRIHGLDPGFGEKALTAETLPPADRFVHRRLLELTAELYDRHLTSPLGRPRVPMSAAARAVGNRNRI